MTRRPNPITVRCARAVDAQIAERFESFGRQVPAELLEQYAPEQAQMLTADTLAAWHRHQERRMSPEGQHGLVPCPECGADAVRFGSTPPTASFRVATCAVCLHHYVRECTRTVNGERITRVWGARADDESALGTRFALGVAMEKKRAALMTQIQQIAHLAVTMQNRAPAADTPLNAVVFGGPGGG